MSYYVFINNFKIDISVDASYNGSLFASLWTFCIMYSIEMPQMHYKINNSTKKNLIKIAKLNNYIY
jgi:hypothetical protein